MGEDRLVEALKKALAGDEAAALEIHHDLSSRFGWAGTQFYREDAEDHLGRPWARAAT